jgi:hypothetical protein
MIEQCLFNLFHVVVYARRWRSLLQCKMGSPIRRVRPECFGGDYDSQDWVVLRTVGRAKSLSTVPAALLMFNCVQ